MPLRYVFAETCCYSLIVVFGYALQALTSAWKEACAAGGSSKVVIPEGTYKSGSVTFEGPCKGPIEVQLDGTLQAPAEAIPHKGGGWLVFLRVEDFTLSGTGTLDGQGTNSYKTNHCGANVFCDLYPTVKFLTNSRDSIELVIKIVVTVASLIFLSTQCIFTILYIYIYIMTLSSINQVVRKSLLNYYLF